MNAQQLSELEDVLKVSSLAALAIRRYSYTAAYLTLLRPHRNQCINCILNIRLLHEAYYFVTKNTKCCIFSRFNDDHIREFYGFGLVSNR